MPLWSLLVAFVGFIGSYTNTLFGVDLALLASATAALAVTCFTLLPSFLFILAGGPLVETTHGNLKLSAPLTAIIAAVVGVIFNPALFFTYHVLWPQDLSSSFEWPAVLITFVASIYVIGACAVMGLIYSLLWR